jgi:hypothetical protein
LIDLGREHDPHLAPQAHRDLPFGHVRAAGRSVVDLSDVRWLREVAYRVTTSLESLAIFVTGVLFLVAVAAANVLTVLR